MSCQTGDLILGMKEWFVIQILLKFHHIKRLKKKNVIISNDAEKLRIKSNAHSCKNSQKNRYTGRHLQFNEEHLQKAFC